MLVAPATASIAIEPGLPADADLAARWVANNEDNGGLPFVIVDKQLARLYVFASTGRLVGESPVLLGLSVGDESIPDIASRTPTSLAPAERTTPAGRFASEPGHNAHGEDIVWFDYDAALAIHRLRASPVSQRRDERMASARNDDKRISYGCIVVPVAFYDAIVRPLLGRQRGVVYVLPETRPVAEMLSDDRFSLRAP
ncbi:MAG: L,D-transpeptidase [Burkholderiales bacterium]